jgi:hypothetical protein
VKMTTIYFVARTFVAWLESLVPTCALEGTPIKIASRTSKNVDIVQVKPIKIWRSN